MTKNRRTANPSWWGSVDEDFYVDPTTQLSIEEILEVFAEMIELQCSPGNYDFDPYMHGMANGMIYMRSLIDGREPQYMEAPGEWLSDLPNSPYTAAVNHRRKSQAQFDYEDGFWEAAAQLRTIVSQVLGV